VLPKEKTIQLAQFELSLAPLFKLHDSISRPRTGLNGTVDAAPNGPPTTPGGTVKEESKRYLLDRLRTTLQSGQQSQTVVPPVQQLPSVAAPQAVNPAVTTTAAATASTANSIPNSVPLNTTMEVEVSLKKTLVGAEEFEDGNIIAVSLKA
jgi:hypothetical protein